MNTGSYFKRNAIQSKRHFQAAVKRAAGFVIGLRAAVVGAAVELFVKQVVHAQAQVYIVVEAVARADAHQAVRFHRLPRQARVALGVVQNHAARFLLAVIGDV